MEVNIELVTEENKDGFLHDYMEQSYEQHLTQVGEVFEAHYRWNQKDCALTGTIRNGKKEGIATMRFMGVTRFELTYTNGELTGPVKELDDQGVTKMGGQLVNGVESGLFEEYNRYGDVIWRGYYRNGKRYSKVVKSEQREGYYDERSEGGGKLLSTSQYDESLHDKNGLCLEYEDGIVKRSCTYVNGKKIQEDTVCHEPMLGMIDYYKEFDSSGRVCRVCEYNDDYELNGTCYEISNGKVKRMCYYQDNMLFQVYQSFDGDEMTEYDNNGERVYIGQYAGDLLKGFFRHGKGKEYQNKQIQYSGSFVSGKREGRGTEFERDQPIYWGYWRNGRRNGREGLGNENEGVVWLDGHVEKDYILTLLPLNLPPFSQILSVSDGQFNQMKSLRLYGFNSLKTITIGCECFQNVSCFDLIGLDSLEKVTIERKSFCGNETTIELEGRCCILDCPHLSTILLGDFCFKNYESLRLANLPSLQTLELGEYCFCRVSSFVFSGLAAWKA